MSKFEYVPENMGEEFAFLAGRVAALEAMLNADNSDFIDKKRCSFNFRYQLHSEKILRLPRR